MYFTLFCFCPDSGRFLLFVFRLVFFVPAEIIYQLVQPFSRHRIDEENFFAPGDFEPFFGKSGVRAFGIDLSDYPDDFPAKIVAVLVAVAVLAGE